MTLWYVLTAIAALTATALVISTLVRRSKPGKLHPSPPKDTPTNRPQPGDIWWADVPFRDGDGAKVRPCVVLRTHRRRVDVLRITSQDKSDRSDHLRIPTKSWDPKATHDSYVDLSEPFRLADRAFTRKAGRIAEAPWRTVRDQHPTGWSA